MKALEHYAITPGGKARFMIRLDTNTWEYIQETAPTIGVTFDLFPDLEAIEIDFLKPTEDAPVAFLSRVPRAWMRMNGELDLYVPDDDPYGIAGYLLDVGEQISPLPISLLPTMGALPAGRQRFNLTFTPSACLIRDPDALDATRGAWSTEADSSLLTIDGFTSHFNPGGSKSHRLSAQMVTMCELLSKELDMDVELDKICGSHSK